MHKSNDRLQSQLQYLSFLLSYHITLSSSLWHPFPANRLHLDISSIPAQFFNPSFQISPSIPAHWSYHIISNHLEIFELGNFTPIYAEGYPECDSILYLLLAFCILNLVTLLSANKCIILSEIWFYLALGTVIWNLNLATLQQ